MVLDASLTFTITLPMLAIDGKALAGIPGPGSLDGRVEGEQIGLFGDGLNGPNDPTDLLSCVSQVGDLATALLHQSLGCARYLGNAVGEFVPGK